MRAGREPEFKRKRPQTKEDFLLQYAVIVEKTFCLPPKSLKFLTVKFCSHFMKMPRNRQF